MKIEDTSTIHRLRQAYGPRGASAADSVQSQEVKNRETKEPQQGASVRPDEVSISPLGRELQKARQAIESNPAIREEKVAELKRLIANGEYTVPNDKLAQKIVDHFLND